MNPDNHDKQSEACPDEDTTDTEERHQEPPKRLLCDNKATGCDDALLGE